MLNNILNNTKQYVVADFKSHPIRCILELLSYTAGISCSITLALLLAKAPLNILYPIWIISDLIFCWAAYTRNSTGMCILTGTGACISAVGLAGILLK